MGHVLDDSTVDMDWINDGHTVSVYIDEGVFNIDCRCPHDRKLRYESQEEHAKVRCSVAIEGKYYGCSVVDVLKDVGPECFEGIFEIWYPNNPIAYRWKNTCGEGELWVKAP
jgi:hypothetical protein